MTCIDRSVMIGEITFNGFCSGLCEKQIEINASTKMTANMIKTANSVSSLSKFEVRTLTLMLSLKTWTSVLQINKTRKNRTIKIGGKSIIIRKE